MKVWNIQIIFYFYVCKFSFWVPDGTANAKTPTGFVAVFQNQKQNSSKFPKKENPSCMISRFALKLKLLRVQLSSVYSSKFTIFRWKELKQRTFIILPTLMRWQCQMCFQWQPRWKGEKWDMEDMERCVWKSEHTETLF